MKQYIVASNLEKSFGENVIFTDGTFVVHKGQKIALIGPNGSGKSTLLKVLAGELTSDEGDLNFSSKTTVGYASQHVNFLENKTIMETMEEIIAPKQIILDEIRALELKFATTPYGSPEFASLSRRYDEKQQIIEEEGVHQLETKIKMLLTRFGFMEKDWSRDVLSLSGGQQIRLHLAKLLLEEPDILMLDEPTNHLDIETIIWLENYLMGYKKAVIFITHDAGLLKKISTDCWQIINKKLFTFKGSYRDYLGHLEMHMETLEREKTKVDKEKKKLADFVDRNLARASTTKRAQSARTRLEKIDDVETMKISQTLKPFNLPVERTSGKFIIKTDALLIGYENEKPLLEPLTTEIMRYERVALLGENGIGKSTFLSTITGDIPALGGTFEVGHHVDISYFKQQQVFSKKNVSVYDTFHDVFPNLTKANIYPILARFGFPQDDVHLNNASLSGGEKQRLLLAMMYQQKSNTLLLDEPTNHLDLDSKQALTDSFLAFDGTIIFASHDRDFIQNIATRIIYFSKFGFQFFDTYEAFESAQLEVEAMIDEDSNAITSSQQERLNQKELDAKIRRQTRIVEATEKEIEACETQLATFEADLQKEENYLDYEKSSRLSQEIETATKKLKTLMRRWEEEQYLLDHIE